MPHNNNTSNIPSSRTTKMTCGGGDILEHSLGFKN
jgi:hypothetical protein